MRFSLLAAWLVFGSAFSVGQIRRSEISPSADGVEVLQALIPAPQPMNAREVGAWQLLCTGVLEGNGDFTKNDLLAFGSQAGVPPKVSWTNEVLCIQFTAPKGGEATIARLVEAAVTRPRIHEEELADLRSRLSAPFADDWSAATMGERGDTVIPTEFIQRFANRAFRPENLILVGTPNAIRATEGRFNDWHPPRVSPDVRVTNAVGFRGPESSKTSVYVGATFLPTTSHAATCLAVIALGGGKTALLHQVLREQHGWTYRQEAFLAPEQAGWRPTIILQSADEFPAKAEIARVLRERASEITTRDLERYKTLTILAIGGNNPLSPFRFPDLYTGTTQDRATWMAFSTLWNTQGMTPEALLADCKRVTLDELKEELNRVLDQLIQVR